MPVSLRNGLRTLIRGSDPATPASGEVAVYAKSDGIYYRDPTGAVTHLTNAAPGNMVKFANAPQGGGVDDSTAINDQINTLATGSSGGGALLLDGSGVYTLLNPLVAQDNVWVCSLGPGGRIFVNTTTASITGDTGVLSFTGSMAAGSTTVTRTAGSSFKATDVGRWVNVGGAGFGGFDLTAQIVSYTNSSNVVVDRTPVTPVTGATCKLGRGNTNIRLIGLEIFGNGSGLPSGSSGGVPATQFICTDGLAVERCHIHHITGMSVFTQGCSNFNAQWNRVHHSGRDGINAFGGLGVAHHITISNNIIWQVGDDGIQVGAHNNADNTAGRSHHVTVASNLVSGDLSQSTQPLGRGVVLLACEEFDVAGNTVTDTSGSGIWVCDDNGSTSSVDPANGQAWTSRNGTVAANTVLRAGQNTQYQPNVTGNPHYGTGIHFTRTDGIISVAANTVKDSFQQPGIYQDSSCTGVHIDESNTVIDSATGGVVDLRERVVAGVSTTNLAALTNQRTVGGYTTTGGETVLLVGQTDPTLNGPWVPPVPIGGTENRLKALDSAWVRPPWFYRGMLAHRASVVVLGGTSAGKTYAMTTGTAGIVVGAGAQSWADSTPPVAPTVGGVGLATDTACTAAANTDILSVTLQPGIYQLTGVVTLTPGGAVNADVGIVAGTATASFTGATGTSGRGVVSASLSLTVSPVVTVTAAGTVLLRVRPAGSTAWTAVAATALASFSPATGLAWIKLA